MQETLQEDNALHFLDYWRVLRSRKEIIIAVTLLVVLTGSLFTFTLPRVYEAESRIRVRQDDLDISVFEREITQGYNPYFLRTEFEIIQSKPVLYKVIDDLDLLATWGKKNNEDGSPLSRSEGHLELKGRLGVEQYRDTSLIAIRVRSEEPNEAAVIANTVANVYRDWRLSDKKDEMQRAIRVLQNEMKKQEEKLNDAELALENIREELDVNLMGGVLSDTVRLRQLGQDRVAARVEMLVRKARYDELKVLEGEELLSASIYLVSDQTLLAIRQQLIDSEVSLKLLQESYGANHPEVKRIQAAVSELTSKLDKALSGLKHGMATDYQVGRAKFEALEEELKAAQALNIESSRQQILPFKQAERRVGVERAILNALRSRVAEEGIKIEVPRTPVQVIDHAEVPQFYVSPNIPLYIALSLVLGLVAGLGLAFFIEYMDTSVKTVDDVERHLGLPVIGVIPQKVHLLYDAGPESQYAETYRVLRTNLQFNTDKSRGVALTVTSGGVGEGKSTTLSNLAYVCASLGDRVLVVDSDLRRPVQHKLLGVSNRTGLTDVLSGRLQLEDVIIPTKAPNLHFLPSGKLTRSMVGALDSQRTKDLLTELRNRYDYIFFDSPPLMGVSDASVLASEMDGVLLVVQYRKYPKVVSARAKRILDSVGANTLGVVLNNINIMRDDYYYYYHSYQSHYDEHNDIHEDAPEEATAARDAL